MTTQSRPRNHYTPSVRPRSARQDGLRRYTPGYLEDLSDTKSRFFSDPGQSDERRTLLTPSRGKRLRLIKLTISQTASDGQHFCELFFGTGESISSHRSKAVALIRVADHGQGSTRTWGRGAGPVGERNEALSIRWTYPPATSHKLIIEYTEER